MLDDPVSDVHRQSSSCYVHKWWKGQGRSLESLLKKKKKKIYIYIYIYMFVYLFILIAG